MVKTIKLALSLNDDTIEYKDLCQALFEMQYLSSKVGNQLMTFLYTAKQTDFIMKDAGIDIPDDRDTYGKTRRAYLYTCARKVMTTSYSSNIGQTTSFIENQFATDVKKGLLKGNVSLTNFRRDAALRIHNKAYSFMETDKGIGVRISLFNKETAKAMGKKTGYVDFLFPHMNKYEKAIISRMMSGDYKCGAGSLTYNRKKKKWMFAMSFHFTPEECTGQNTLIVRLDSEVLLRLEVMNEATKEIKPMGKYDDIVPGLEELEAVQKKMLAMRRSYGNSTRIASKNNYGKGYHKRADKLLALRDKEARFRDTFNHKISRYVIEIAKRYDCGLIKLEDFSKTENSAFGNWAYYDLENKITYKAAEIGIQVMESKSNEEAADEE